MGRQMVLNRLLHNVYLKIHLSRYAAIKYLTTKTTDYFLLLPLYKEVSMPL